MNTKPGCQCNQEEFLHSKDKIALWYKKENAVWWGLLLFWMCVYMRSLGCGVELLMVYLICANSICVDSWMQLQLGVFAFMVKLFYHSLHSYQGESPELPLISCSVAPLGQKVWANIILKGYQGNLKPLSSFETFGLLVGGFWEGCLFRCCSTAGVCLPLRGQHIRNVLFPKQSYQKEQDRTATKLHYKSSGPCSDTTH